MMTTLKSNKIIFLNTLVTILLVSFPKLTFSQNIMFVKNSQSISPLIIMIIEDSIIVDMKNKINDVSNKNNTAFLIANGSKCIISGIKDSVNTLLNNNWSISKNNIYLFIVGSKGFFENQNKFYNDLFPSKYFIQTDKEPIDDKSYTKVKYVDLNLSEILNDLKKDRLLEIELNRIMQSNKINKSNYTVGFGITEHIPTKFKFNSEIGLPNNLTYYNLSFSHTHFGTIKIVESFAFGFKKPNMQDSNSGMSGYNSFTFGIDVLKMYNTKRKLNIYSGIGIFTSSFTSMEADTDDNSTPSINRYNFKNWGVSINSGLNYKIGDNTSCNFKVAYKIDLNKHFESSSYLNGLDFQLGISVKVFKGMNNYYEFLRLKE